MPMYQSNGASGADLCAHLKEDITINVGCTSLIPTGVFMEIPEGFEAQVRPRSGLALNKGITLLNSPGTIDSDFRGEIKLIVTNFGKESFVITNGMRIGQIVFNKVYKAQFIKSSLSQSDRGDGGFGHTGIWKEI